ncbi:MAG: helix-turn-helix transcriptional regulator [Lacipirellulaceae bacterium]
MNIEKLSDDAILQEIGERLKRARLNRNLTQQSLASKAGIGRRTLQKAEDGQVTTLETLVAILRGLGLISELNSFLPETPLSPVQLVKLQGKTRKRASGKRKTEKAKKSWKWGE